MKSVPSRRLAFGKRPETTELPNRVKFDDHHEENRKSLYLFKCIPYDKQI
jgi:hypothetical protein